MTESKQDETQIDLEKPQWTLEPPAKRGYLTFLRVFGTVQLIIGAIATLVFAVALKTSLEQYGGASPVFVLAALSVAVEGLLAYGLLNAIADIAENLILVGWFIKKTDSKGR
jgi:hypothetical protein